MTSPLRHTLPLLAALPLAILAIAASGEAPLRAATPTADRTPQLSAHPAAVAPGATVTMTGRGFPPNVHVALMAGPREGPMARMGGARTGMRGRFTATIHIRPRAAAARLVAVACLDRCSVKASAPFRIAAP